MRATLIIPALFALSLVGGSALAERPGQDHPNREPKMDVVRGHGDVVDRYDHASVPAPVSERTSSSTQSQPTAHAVEKLDAPRSHGDIVDHAYSSSVTAVTKSSAQRYGSASYTHTPQPTQKLQERENCSTAQDDCAANRANKFAGTHAAHLTKSGKSDSAKPTYAWKAEDATKAKSSSGSVPAGLASLTATQQASLAKLLKAKMCAHAASQDGCGGGSDD